MKILKRDIIYLNSYNNAVTSVCSEGDLLSNETGYPLDVMEKNLKIRVEQDLPQFFAISENNEVIGWCDITPGTKEYFKHVGYLGMGVIKEYRKKGLGYRLLKETLNYAKIRKIEKVELEVYSRNKTAINFYKKMGFEIEGIKKNSKKNRGKYDDIILMGKMLI